MSQKLLIVLLVVLALIFLITLGMGGCHSGTPTPNRAGFVGSLKGLQGNRFLTIGDKASTTCDVLNASTLRVNTKCFVFFQKRAFFRKSTRVVFKANAPLHVTIDPKDGRRQEAGLSTLECFASAVNHSGGTMTLEATGSAIVVLQRGPC